MAHLDKARLSHVAAVEGCVFVNLKISYLFRDAIVHQLQFMWLSLKGPAKWNFDVLRSNLARPEKSFLNVDI